ncbi:ribulose bisphosphate carboxylase small subunit [Candidatus Thioglobus sp.]|uniref:ribulose bisphosphate carboxylase small subunit n=1 Tax=Candidatus Thioglobus sp. TaxID=2026721 RepID=UPI003D0E23A1
MSKPSINEYQTKSTLETFSFLPPLTADDIYDQLVYIINQGWTPSLEHETPSQSMSTYWGMWKLPFFGMRDPNEILAEIEQCRQTYPEHLIRVVGYDNYTQCLGHSFVVHRPRGL